MNIGSCISKCMLGNTRKYPLHIYKTIDYQAFSQIIKSKKRKKMKVLFIAFSMAFAIASMEGSVVEQRPGKIYGIFSKYIP